MRLVTTHDWTSSVDVDHLVSVRADPDRFAAGGVLHLVLEVLAYAVDEAVEGSTLFGEGGDVVGLSASRR